MPGGRKPYVPLGPTRLGKAGPSKATGPAKRPGPGKPSGPKRSKPITRSAGKFAKTGGANRNIRRPNQTRKNELRAASKAQGRSSPIKTPRGLAAAQKPYDVNAPRLGSLAEQNIKNRQRFAAAASAKAAADTKAAAKNAVPNTNRGTGLQEPTPAGEKYGGEGAIAQYFRMFSSKIAPLVGYNIARGLAGNNVLGAIRDATPGLAIPAPWKQGIRAYYPQAKTLKGLDVRDNWAFELRAFDLDAKIGKTFLIGSLSNPHPGAQMLFYGQEKTGWLIEPRYNNPDNEGKTPKHLRFIGKKTQGFAALIKRENPVPIRETFRKRIAEIISKKNDESAQDLFNKVHKLTMERLGFGQKRALYLNWNYTDKQLAAMHAAAAADQRGGFSR